ncbi:MAG: hypothetical protein ACKV22_27430 [Bryobacteraceae bacterium]
MSDAATVKMPYCSQCGNEVRPADLYCGKCGSRQPIQPSQPRGEPLSNLTANQASVLCYVPFLGWIMSVVVLATDRFRADRTVRFHAFQGLYLFVAWLLVDQFVGPLFRHLHGGRQMAHLLEFAVIGAMIFMLVKVSKKRSYSLPIIGELAEKSVAEL